MQSIRPGESGRWEILTTDDVLMVDTRGGVLVSLRDGSFELVSVDQCELGLPVALTVREADGMLTPWFGADIVTIREA